MSDIPFWQSKTLDEMTDAEWESLCDGCGQCCLHKLTRDNLPTFEWLPMTCAYRLLAEGKGLPEWHPLLTGSKAAMHGERISVRHIAVKESEVRDWQDHILNKPSWAD